MSNPGWTRSETPPPPVVDDFFKSFSKHALGQLRAWLDDELDAMGGGGNGLQYHLGTYGPLNVGDWLSVETTAAVGQVGPNGYGIEINDNGGNNGGGIHIVNNSTNDSPIRIVQHDDGGTFILDDGGGGILIDADSGSVKISGQSNDFLQVGTVAIGFTGVTIDLEIGSAFSIRNSADTQIFRVNEDGTITPGINFDQANTGGYLDIKTTDSGGSRLWLSDYFFWAEDPDVALFDNTEFVWWDGTTFQVANSGNVGIEVGTSIGLIAGTDITLSALTVENALASTGDFSITAAVGTIFQVTDAGSLFHYLGSGESFDVYDSAVSEIFKISEAGEIFAHLPTAAGTAGSLWNDSGTVKVA